MALWIALIAGGLQSVIASNDDIFAVDFGPKLDSCGVCGGFEGSCEDCTSFIDCTGKCGGTVIIDDCGVCGGDSSSCRGCKDSSACNVNVYATVTDNSLCTYGTSSSEGFDCWGNCIDGYDCAGDCGGNAETDACGVCGGNSAACASDFCSSGDVDCTGSCIVNSNDATATDECGVCGGDSSSCTGCKDPDACNYDKNALFSGLCEYPASEGSSCAGGCMLGYEADCAGICGGTFIVDICGVCGGDGSTCYSCPDSDACNYDENMLNPPNMDICTFPDDQFACNGLCAGIIDCRGICGGSSVEDDCGICDGDSSSCAGCHDEEACNFSPLTAASDDSLCTYGRSLTSSCLDDDSCVEYCDENGSCAFYYITMQKDSPSDCWGNCKLGFDCAGDCGGTKRLDACGVCGGDGAYDCTGVCGGSAKADACGICGGDSSACTGCMDKNACNYMPAAVINATEECLYAESEMECDVLCTTEANYPFDCFGNCAVEIDCYGVCDGSAISDWCGICEGKNEHIDCNGNCGGIMVFDDCGVCGGDGSTCVGCSDPLACNYNTFATTLGTALCTYSEEGYDCYGTCTAGLDCAGECGGDATLNVCGICSDSDISCTSQYCGFNSDESRILPDCRGKCGGSERFDICGVCGGDSTSCVGCTDVLACNYNNGATIPAQCWFESEYYDCNGECTDYDCTGECGGGRLLDDCGICDGNNNFIDCAGVCLGASVNDRCGVCGGDDSTCVGCTDTSACNYFADATISNDPYCTYAEENYDCFGNCALDKDCEGTCAGTVEVDLCGVCGGDNTGCTGCTDSNACNYDANAGVLDDSCQFAESDFHDCFGNCLIEVDCEGICGGTSFEDSCGICGGNGTCPDNCNYDCTGQCDGASTLDSCGVCGGDSSSCRGCTDSAACNYDQFAVLDSGDCLYIEDPLYDCFGNCIDPDCNGVCGGTSSLDACGVCEGDSDTCTGCTDNTACNYDETAVFDDGSCFAPSSLLVDCFDNCVVDNDCAGTCGGTLVEDACGVCGGSGASKDCSGICDGTHVLDACGICDGDSSTCVGCMDPNACNYDSSVTYSDGSCSYEGDFNCFGICLVDTDCAGVCGGSATIDECNVCGGYGDTCTDDYCSDGTLDCAGECNGSHSVDNCGVCGKPGDSNWGLASCDQLCDDADCFGDCGGTASYDECGACGGDGASCSSYCNNEGDEIGCDGACNSGITYDACQVCGGDSSSCTGCPDSTACNYDANRNFDDDNICYFSTQNYDCAGVCSVDEDCAGICGGSTVVDICGICGGNGASMDCSGVCGGSLIEDECGSCGGDGSACSESGCTASAACNYFEPATIDDGSCWYAADMYGIGYDCFGNCASDPDCTGMCGGTAEEDDCGVCNGGNNNMDCFGHCFGTAELDSCGVCGGDGTLCATCPTVDCAGECDGTHIMDETCQPSTCISASDTTQDCAGECFGSAEEDECGICGGDGTQCVGCLDGFACNFDAGKTVQGGFPSDMDSNLVFYLDAWEETGRGPAGDVWPTNIPVDSDNYLQWTRVNIGSTGTFTLDSAEGVDGYVTLGDFTFGELGVDGVENLDYAYKQEDVAGFPVGNEAFTWEMAYAQGFGGSEDEYLVSFGDATSGADNSIYIDWSNGGTICHSFGCSDATTSLAEDSLVINVLVVTFDGTSTLNFYLNGKLETSVETSGVYVEHTETQSFVVGGGTLDRESLVRRSFTGALYFVRLYDTALSSETIKAHYSESQSSQTFAYRLSNPCRYPFPTQVDCEGDCENNLEKDCAGLCGGETLIDGCGVCGGDDLQCTGCADRDACNYDASALVKDDLVCTYPPTGYDCSNACIEVDCDDVCGGSAVLDDCGVCGGDSSTCPGCVGDDCLVCDGAEFDCDGVCGGTSTVDACGVCGGNSLSCVYPYCGEGIDVDCAGTCAGVIEDACGICGGDSSTCGGCLVPYACDYDATVDVQATYEVTEVCDGDLEEYGSCYTFFAEPQTYARAQATCESSGGNLAYPSRNSLLDSFGSLAGDADYWIGLYSSDSCKFELSSLDVVVFTNWDTNEPSNCDTCEERYQEDSGECCAAVQSDGNWASALCGEEKAFWCERGERAFSCDFPDVGFDCNGNCLLGVDCAGTCGGSTVEDSCGVCGGNGVCPSDCSYDCFGYCDGSAYVDVCGVCDGQGNSLDCLGECDGLTFNDACGVCGGDSSQCIGCTDSSACNFDATAAVDDNSCTWPDNEDLDCFGNCYGDYDCFGQCGGSAVEDSCGICGGNDNAVSCDGICFGSATVDECGECGGDNSACSGCTDSTACSFDFAATVSDPDACTYPPTNSDCYGNCMVDVDCAAVCGGTAVEDACGICGGDSTSCVGCTDSSACNYASQAIMSSDDCTYAVENFACNGICAVDIDCAGECGGSATTDSCGVCGGFGATCALDYCPSNILDCHGECNGEAELDSCGVCGGDSSSCTGCQDSAACNFDSSATLSDDNSCTFAESNYDCNGICIATTDCFNVCGGTAVEDACGICDGNGATCVDDFCSDNTVDCNGNCGGSATTDACGVCGGDSTTCSGCRSADACNYDAGALLDGETCTYATTGFTCAGICATEPDCEGVCGGTANLDSCNVCGGDGTSCAGVICSGVFDCAGNCDGFAFEDTCGICGGDSSTCVGCTAAGACNYDQYAIISSNDCSYVTDLNYDCNGICINGFDCAGECGGVQVADSCGVCGGNGATCADNFCSEGQVDCAGFCDGSAIQDACGVCGGDSSSCVSASCTDGYDCQGNCGGSISIDSCGVCGGAGASCATSECNTDCSGACDGTTVEDSCGVCGGDGSTCVCAAGIIGCDGACDSGTTFDSCGVCGGDGTACSDPNYCANDDDVDCMGLCGGSAIKDVCGVCGGDSSSCCTCNYCEGGTIDCAGTCNGELVEDECGICGGHGETCTQNYCLNGDVDCNGVCDGTAQTDSCGICNGDGSSCFCSDGLVDCHGTCGGSAIYDKCGVCGGFGSLCTDNFCADGNVDCLGECNGNRVTDSCGVCNGDGSSCMEGTTFCQFGTLDCLGNCNGDAKIDSCGVCGQSGQTCGAFNCFSEIFDCQGICDGTSVVDACGVCGGDNDTCDPCGSFLGRKIIPDCAGICDGSLSRDICGVCGGNGASCSTVDTMCAVGSPDCFGVCNGGALIDSCGVCGGNDSSCFCEGGDVDCEGICDGSASRDSCGVCEGDGSSCTSSAVADCDNNAALIDCEGICGGSSVTDNCGICGGDGLTCGACAGGTVDCTGKCDGSAVIDSCGVCGGFGGSCRTDKTFCPDDEVDCAGECAGTHELDACGVCGGTHTNPFNCECAEGKELDCANTCGGTAQLDECGVCGGFSETCTDNYCAYGMLDCAGECDGTHMVDECGICGGDGSSCQCAYADCQGVCGGSAMFDSCGVCGGYGASCSDNFCFDGVIDCSGECDGNNRIDLCGVCGGDGSTCQSCPSYDCSGVCDGSSSFDECGVCGGFGATCTDAYCQNGKLDCAGECDGSHETDECGICGGSSACAEQCNYDCNGECGGSSVVDSCGVCGGTGWTCAENTCEDVGCDGQCGSGVVLDACSICGGDSSTCTGCWNTNACNYASSGSCSYPDEGYNCFGVCIVDNDCNGQCGGSATEDDCGICNGNGATCATEFCDEEVDCAGTCGGSTKEDDCGVCGGDSSSCTGCMEETACNYNPSAISTGNAVCTFAVEGLDCNGNCIGDEDCSGVCGGTSVDDACGICGGDSSSSS